MDERSVQDAMSRIRKVIHHIGTFEQSFPKVIKGTQQYTRSHLIVLRDCLPDLKKLIRYAADSVPAAFRASGTANQGLSGLTQASEMLGEIRRSTENAVNEIFDVMDRVDPLLEKISEAEHAQGNLIVNAADAMEGSPERVLRIRLKASEGCIQGEISDTGQGIPKEDLERIFQPFYSTKPEGRGTGLGLSIVKSALDRHGGSIRVESEMGAGTRFHLSFPTTGNATAGSDAVEQEHE